MDKLASSVSREGLLLYPAREGGASSDEANSAGIGKRVLWAKENSLASASNGGISETTAPFVDNTLNLASSEFAGGALERGNVGVMNLSLDLLEALKGASGLRARACFHIEGLDEALTVADAAVLLTHFHLGGLNLC